MTPRLKYLLYFFLLIAVGGLFLRGTQLYRYYQSPEYQTFKNFDDQPLQDLRQKASPIR